MDETSSTRVALVYDDDAYVERTRPISPRGPMGLMGRQVAGKEFLQAYLEYGSATHLTAVVKTRGQAEGLVAAMRDHPASHRRARHLRVVSQARFHAEFLHTPPAPLLYSPCPPDERYVWARASAGTIGFSVCGVTHTLASVAAVQALAGLVTVPFETCDALICTSRAVLDMVRAVTGAVADDLRARFGGSPRVKPRLEVIPLGVDVERFRPATSDERSKARLKLGVPDDALMLLFVGRLSHHAKAHPFPMYAAAAQAAQATGQRLHLVLAGWTAHPAVHEAFVEGAAAFAPGVVVKIVDGTDPGLRSGVWQAADLFISLSDNIQETFGLVIVEAMASGLPVLASDWNGYRDLVVDGVTGFLVPTTMITGSGSSLPGRLMFGEFPYDLFLAATSQGCAVDVRATGAALTRLVADRPLRLRMGEEGRRRAVQHYAWRHVIGAYETLWREQEKERQTLTMSGPAWQYPPLELAFKGYPTRWLKAESTVLTTSGARERLGVLLSAPLTNHVRETRVSDSVVLAQALQAAETGCTIAVLDDIFTRSGVPPEAARASTAWLLKYGLLEAGERVAGERGALAP